VRALTEMLESYEREIESLEGSIKEAEEDLENTRCVVCVCVCARALWCVFCVSARACVALGGDALCTQASLCARSTVVWWCVQALC
jgi:hypothetical protein